MQDEKKAVRKMVFVVARMVFFVVLRYEKLLTQCANLTAAMDVMGRARQAGGENRAQVLRRATNIVRPLKGGGQVGSQHPLEVSQKHST